MATKYYAVGFKNNYINDQRIPRSVEDRAKVRAALKGKPNRFSTMVHAEQFHASLPVDVQPLTEAFEFIYL